MHIVINARIWPRETSLISSSCMLKGHGITAFPWLLVVSRSVQLYVAYFAW